MQLVVGWTLLAWRGCRRSTWRHFCLEWNTAVFTKSVTVLVGRSALGTETRHGFPCGREFRKWRTAL